MFSIKGLYDYVKKTCESLQQYDYVNKTCNILAIKGLYEIT
jgi:hypothetical protein